MEPNKVTGNISCAINWERKKMKKRLKILVLNLATTVLTAMTSGGSPNISEASIYLIYKIKKESGRVWEEKMLFFS